MSRPAAAWDVVVIGGGPAGAAAAACLAETGRRVLLLERTVGPRQSVCGEFIGADAAGLLAGMGVDLAALGALPVERLRLTAGGREATLPLPFPAWSLGRDCFDEALRRAARERGAELWRGHAASGLSCGPDGVRVQWRGRQVEGGAAVLASGKHDLRGQRRAGRVRLGFKQWWRLEADQRRRLDGVVEVHLFRGGYAGLQAARGGCANLCLSVEPALYRRCGSWEALLHHLAAEAPGLARRMEAAQPAWPRPLAVAGPAHGYAAAPGSHRLHRVGDQLAVIHSLFGEGLAIALCSGREAGQRIAGNSAPASAARYRPALRLAGAAAAALSLMPAAAVGLAGLRPDWAAWVAARTRCRPSAGPDARGCSL